MEKKTIQKYSRSLASPFDVAVSYYSALSALNHLSLGEKEIQLVALIATSSMPHKQLREEFTERFKSSRPSVANMIAKLRKKKVLMEDNTINSYAHPDFDSPIQLIVTLKVMTPNGETV